MVGMPYTTGGIPHLKEGMGRGEGEGCVGWDAIREPTSEASWGG